MHECTPDGPLYSNLHQVLTLKSKCLHIFLISIHTVYFVYFDVWTNMAQLSSANLTLISAFEYTCNSMYSVQSVHRKYLNERYKLSIILQRMLDDAIV